MANEVQGINKANKWRIDKNLLPAKILLFCFYAGAFGTTAFLPVFLKYQGLTITHYSIFTASSVCLQFLGGVIAGFLADKIGRIKPFWFFFLGLYCFASLSLATLPRANECKVENASFECYDEEMAHFTASSCRNNSKAILCSRISMHSGNNSVYQNGSSNLVIYTLNPKLDVNSEMEKMNNLSGLYTFSSDCSNCSFNIMPLCSLDSCGLKHISCSAHYVDCNKNVKLWIIIYGILVVLHSFAGTNVFRFNDIIVSNLAFESNSDYGRQRIFGIFGSMFGPPTIGVILNAINGSTNEKTYTPVFIYAIIFSVLSACSMWFLNVKFHKPTNKMWKKSFGLVKNLDIMMFFAFLITMGSVTCFQFTYRNWYLKELNASDLLTGIVSGWPSLYGLPFLYISKWWIKKVGLRNIFILGLLAHIVYSFSFAAMKEPWIAIILESTSIFSYHLFWVSVMKYSHLVPPDGLEAIMKALAGSLHFNIGRIVSSLVAGYVMGVYGGRMAFIVLGCLAFAHLIVYGTYLIVRHLKKRKTRIPLELDTEKEFPEEEQNFA